MLGLLICFVTTVILYYQAGMIPLDDWFDTVVSKGDEVFHWGNTTFDSIIEQVVCMSSLLCRFLITYLPLMRLVTTGQSLRTS